MKLFATKQIFGIIQKRKKRGDYMLNEKNKIVIFENQDMKLEVNMKEETVWLTQKQMAKLFDKDQNTINDHINNIFKEGELDEITSTGISGKSSFIQFAFFEYVVDMIIYSILIFIK